MFPVNCQKVLDEMNYKQIAHAMNSLALRWEGYDIIDEYTVEEFAVETMLNALEWRIENFHIYQSGGFVVIMDGDNVRMSFEITSVDSVELE